jgi:hypothetical protein
MDSKDEKRCEWCGRPFATNANPQATTQLGPGGPQATVAMPQAGQTATAAPPQDRRAAQSFVVEAIQIEPLGIRIERYLGVMLLLLAVGQFAAHAYPQQWIWVLYPSILASGLLLGVFRVIGYYDDEYSDVLILLAISAFIGPLYATVAYLLIGLIRQSVNVSMLVLMASFFVFRTFIGGAAHGFMDTLGYLTMFRVNIDPFVLVISLFPMACLFGGWMMASFWRPLNEA